MANERFTLVLDKAMLAKTPTVYIYRSRETYAGRPIIDGLYVQRSHLAEPAPEQIAITIEWPSEES